MAIAMYEALGKSMSSYRKNLQDIDKGSIKSDLVFSIQLNIDFLVFRIGS